MPLWSLPGRATGHVALSTTVVLIVADRLKSYVYRLIDTRNGEPFDVGNPNKDVLFLTR